MFATNKIGAHLQLSTTFLFDELPSFREALTRSSPEREQRLRDPEVRARMRREIAEPGGRAFVFIWDVVSVEAVSKPENQRLVGQSIPELAPRSARTRSTPSSTSRCRRTSRPSSRSSCR
jgi:hypothetical protein